MNEGPISDFLEEAKEAAGFPPSNDRIAGIKSAEAAAGRLYGGALVEATARAYREPIHATLRAFTKAVIDKAETLGLASHSEIESAIHQATSDLFTLAGGHIAKDLKGWSHNDTTLAIAELEDGRAELAESLRRKVRLRDLTHQASAKMAPEKEFEQKFEILLSVTQAQRDFDAWSAELTEPDSSIAVLFVDLDRFKHLNERYTETIVDQTILPRAQVLIASLVKARGGAYRHEAMVFGEKVRARFEAQEFEIGQARERVTVSVGVAAWPAHGATYPEVLYAANEAEHVAKQSRNAVERAGGRQSQEDS